MYNGIGLQTARGSGTNGYVQANLAHFKQKKKALERKAVNDDDRPMLDPTLVLHEKKRQIEVQCAKLQESLQDDGDSDVDGKVQALRDRLRLELDRELRMDPKQLKEYETHKLRIAKEKEIERFRRALGIGEPRHRPDDRQEGKRRYWRQDRSASPSQSRRVANPPRSRSRDRYENQAR